MVCIWSLSACAVKDIKENKMDSMEMVRTGVDRISIHQSAVKNQASQINQTKMLLPPVQNRVTAVGDIVTVLLDDEKNMPENQASYHSSVQMNVESAHDRNIEQSLENWPQKEQMTSDSIAVEVIQILQNGNLMIQGEKWLTLDSGDEYIRLSGMIRPQDISDENTIASIQIANTRIQYSGIDSEKEIPWLTRYFNVIL